MIKTGIQVGGFVVSELSEAMHNVIKRPCIKLLGIYSALYFSFLSVPESALAQESQDEMQIALSLANTLRAARTVIANNQSLINDASIEDKGLTGEKVVGETVSRVKIDWSQDLDLIERGSIHGQLVQSLLESIDEVMQENQPTINRAGTGFKGFVPAVFARLVNERFIEKSGQHAKIKVTAPVELVRNRKAKPDSWERNVIEQKFTSEQWERGAIFSENAESGSRLAFRMMVPEYYGNACLSCHGNPKDEIDITGYPKEGGELGELGGAISISLYQ